MSRKFVIDNALTLIEKASLPRSAKSKWRPAFIRLAREYSRAGITSNRQIARLLGVNIATIAKWRAEYPAFDSSIDGGEDELAIECTSRMLELSRGGSETATRYLLDRRVESFKPKSGVDHTSNGETLSALLAQQAEMSDKEALEKGLIIDDETEESEPPGRASRHE